MQREIFGRDDLRVTFGLSEAARASQRGAIATAYEQAVAARGEVPSLERLDREYTPITSGLTACSGYAGRDFKLIVGSALLELTVVQVGRPILDIIVVKAHSAQGYCVLVTEAGAKRIVAVARSMTFEAAERARASKPPKGADADAAKHGLDALAELGLTNVLGLALPDTRELTSEQVEAVLAATCAIRKATVEGGEGLWAAINTLAQAAAAAAPPLLAMDAAAPPPQLVEVAARPVLAGPGDASDAETEVGGAEGGAPSARAPTPKAAEVVAPKAAAPAASRPSRKRKAGAASGGGEGGGGEAKVRRKRGAASVDQPTEAVVAQADAPAQPPPLAASPPTPEEATQRLREALASSDEAAAALALEALAGVVKTKAALRSTSTMCLPNTRANTRAPPPRHLVPHQARARSSIARTCRRRCARAPRSSWGRGRRSRDACVCAESMGWEDRRELEWGGVWGGVERVENCHAEKCACTFV